jgi:hypothetical protein
MERQHAQTCIANRVMIRPTDRGIFFFFLVALVASFLFGCVFGRRSAYWTLRNVARADANFASTNSNKQLFEYIKSRYYYFSNRAGVRLRMGEGDFGPVDESLLKGYSAGKGPTSFVEEYDDYRRLLPKQ